MVKCWLLTSLVSFILAGAAEPATIVPYNRVASISSGSAEVQSVAKDPEISEEALAEYLTYLQLIQLMKKQQQLLQGERFVYKDLIDWPLFMKNISVITPLTAPEQDSSSSTPAPKPADDVAAPSQASVLEMQDSGSQPNTPLNRLIGWLDSIQTAKERFLLNLGEAITPRPLLRGFVAIPPRHYGRTHANVFPDIPLLGHLNPGAWTDEEWDYLFGQQVVNLGGNFNTIIEIPGVLRYYTNPLLKFPPLELAAPF